MSGWSAAAVAAQSAPRAGADLLLAAAAAIICPFDCVLIGMVGAGLGIEAICAYLGLSREALDYNLVRLDLRTPHDRPRRRGGCRAWSDDDLRLAIGWRREGVHPASIGAALGRSTTAVRAKLHRIGVPPPHRKALHRVDAAALSRVPPSFGFPAAPAERETVPATSQQRGTVVSLALPGAVAPATEQRPAEPRASGRQNTDAAPAQCSLNLLRVVTGAKEVPADEAPRAAASQPTASQPDLPPPAASVAAATEPRPQVVGPAALIERYRTPGKVRRPDANEAYLTWLTLLYLGGMHYRAMADYLGRSPSAVQSVLNRMQLPRDGDRRKFGWTCDLECALATLESWRYVLQRSNSPPERAIHDRPLFWRGVDDRGNRLRRNDRMRLQRRDNGYDYDKYKGGLTVSIITRAELDARKAAAAGSGAARSGRLHAPVQGSLPIQQGARHEQRTFRGHPPALGPGLPGEPRDPMPWAHARHGGAARPVAHP